MNRAAWRSVSIAGGAGARRARSGPAAPAAAAASALEYDQGQSAARPEALRRGGRQAAGRSPRRDPTSPPGWYALALAARRAGNCTEAIPAYRRYAALRATEAEPYFGLGLCLRDTGDRPAAVTAFKRFLELEHRPGQEKWIETAKGAIAALEAPPPPAGGAAAAYEEAQRLRDRGQVEAALKRFADAAALDPDLIVARAAWGELLLKVHREKDAVPVFRGAVERNPQYPLAWYELAFALRETGAVRERDRRLSPLHRAAARRSGSALRHGARACTPSGATTRPGAASRPTSRWRTAPASSAGSRRPGGRSRRSTRRARARRRGYRGG